MPTVHFNATTLRSDHPCACDFLAGQTGLPKGRIKDAMNKGAVWLKRSRRKRLRRASARIRPGDRLELYYDEKILALRPLEAMLLEDRQAYSVWIKPAGMPTQGSKYGDHCSLLRQVELFYGRQRAVFPVHRLDREVYGLVMIAHSHRAARELSRLFRTHRIVKVYQAVVRGHPAPTNGTVRIERPLDGKPSITDFDVRRYDPSTDTATVDVRLKTGRRHQLRRHFELIGHPVIGDPKYGRKNKNTEGLQLRAVKLEFYCPFAKKYSVFSIRKAAMR